MPSGPASWHLPLSTWGCQPIPTQDLIILLMTEPQILKHDYMTNLAMLCQEAQASEARAFEYQQAPNHRTIKIQYRQAPSCDWVVSQNFVSWLFRTQTVFPMTVVIDANKDKGGVDPGVELGTRCAHVRLWHTAPCPLGYQVS